MLLVLRSQIEEVETVAAACHILYSITHDDAVRGSPPVDIENQLHQKDFTGEERSVQSGHLGNEGALLTMRLSGTPLQMAASALVLVLQWHAQRRDVTRACVRSITNLSRYASFLKTLHLLGIADPLLAAVVLHPHARDITESAIKMVKSLAKTSKDQDIVVRNSKCKELPLHVTVAGIPGLLLCLKARPAVQKVNSIRK